MKAFILVQHLANLAHDRRAFVQACADEATSTPDEIERWLIGGAKALSREQQVQVVQASGYSNRTLSGENVHYMRLVEDTKRPLVEHPGYIAMSMLLGLTEIEQELLDCGLQTRGLPFFGSRSAVATPKLALLVATVQSRTLAPIPDRADSFSQVSGRRRFLATTEVPLEQSFTARRSDEVLRQASQKISAEASATVALLPDPAIYIVRSAEDRSTASPTHYIISSGHAKVVLEVRRPLLGGGRFSDWIERAVLLLYRRRIATGMLPLSIRRPAVLVLGATGIARVRGRELFPAEVDLAVSGRSLEELHDQTAWRDVYHYASSQGVVPSEARQVVMAAVCARRAESSQPIEGVAKVVADAAADTATAGNSHAGTALATTTPTHRPWAPSRFVASEAIVQGGFIQVETRRRDDVESTTATPKYAVGGM